MNIFAQYCDTKLINSLAYTGNDHNVACATINNDLYRIHYQYAFDAYVFCDSLANEEIHCFIKDFGNTKRIIYYHDKSINHQAIAQLQHLCTHIGHEQQDGVLLMPYLVLPNVFNTDLRSTKRDNQQILCFLYGDTIPPNLDSVLYPSTTLPIKIFSKTIEHPQNLGIITEQEKAQLLQTSTFYLVDGKDYLVEAYLCGCSLVKLENGEIKICDTKEVLEQITYISYHQFVNSIL